MAKFSGYLNMGSMFGVEIGEYLIDSSFNYYNRAAMIIDTMMNAGVSCFDKAVAYRRCGSHLSAEKEKNKGCAIMNTLFAWREIPSKRPPECAASWLDDAWCTLHQAYEHYVG